MYRSSCSAAKCDSCPSVILYVIQHYSVSWDSRVLPCINRFGRVSLFELSANILFKSFPFRQFGLALWFVLCSAPHFLGCYVCWSSPFRFHDGVAFAVCSTSVCVRLPTFLYTLIYPVYKRYIR
jgi:hypothetical protein